MIAPFIAAKTLFVNPEKNQNIDDELIIHSESSLLNWLDVHFRRSQSKTQLLQATICTDSVSNSTANAFFSFLAGKPTEAITQEEGYIIGLAKNIMEASGDYQFKIQVLLNVLSTLGNNAPTQDPTGLQSIAMN